MENRIIKKDNPFATIAPDNKWRTCHRYNGQVIPADWIPTESELGSDWFEGITYEISVDVKDIKWRNIIGDVKHDVLPHVGGIHITSSGGGTTLTEYETCEAFDSLETGFEVELDGDAQTLTELLTNFPYPDIRFCNRHVQGIPIFQTDTSGTKMRFAIKADKSNEVRVKDFLLSGHIKISLVSESRTSFIATADIFRDKARPYFVYRTEQFGEKSYFSSEDCYYDDLGPLKNTNFNEK